MPITDHTRHYGAEELARLERECQRIQDRLAPLVCTIEIEIRDQIELPGYIYPTKASCCTVTIQSFPSPMVFSFAHGSEHAFRVRLWKPINDALVAYAKEVLLQRTAHKEVMLSLALGDPIPS